MKRKPTRLIPVQQPLGLRLRNARNNRRMTLHALSQASGVGIGTISELETKEDRFPTLNTLNKLARALSIDVTELLARD